jgi:RNA polymerase sigma-70 factor (ECF subfamily)
MNEEHDFLRRFTQAQPALRRYVLAHVPDFHQAEDVLQEAAVVLWGRRAEFDPARSFEAWAFGIARNKLLSSKRGVAVRREVLTPQLSERVAAKLGELAPQFEQRRGRLRDCVRKLAERARLVVEQRYDQGLSTQAIAESTGDSVNAVRILLCRVRRTLARCLSGAV